MRRVLLIASLLAGCAGAGAAPESSLTGTEWLLVSVRGEPPAAGATVTLRFDDERSAGGEAPCNLYGGSYKARGNAIDWGAMRTTRRACVERALMDLETAYLAALSEATQFFVEDERLVLLADDGSPAVEFMRRRSAVDGL